jgi:hypothetical protein
LSLKSKVESGSAESRNLQREPSFPAGTGNE